MFVNDSLSEYSKRDLVKLLEKLKEYKLSLRDKLSISEKETFGFEIECEEANWHEIYINKENDWPLVDDMSLCFGAELKSPILINTKENWLTLKRMCDLVSQNAELGANCGGHVHIGIQSLGKERESLINFMKLWALYEHIIFRFSYNEFLGPRFGLYTTAKPVKDDFLRLIYNYEHKYIDYEDLICFLSKEKYKAVNFKHLDSLGTIEFRCPNGTFNPTIWQNNVNLFVKMLKYSSSNKFDKEFINKRIDQISIKEPNKIYLKDALELADLIFDNNLDKIYFLKQYLKSFEKSNEYKLAKTFS